VTLGRALASTLALSIPFLDASGATAAEPATVAQGRALYAAHCISCHGVGGKGDGRRAGGLNPAPADLTGLAARHGGAFDADAVAAHIDGRASVRQHGPRTMPVWGQQKQLARADIDALVAYLKSLQPAAQPESGVGCCKRD
jgi:mono/diheme cytochrome c family protein